MPGQRRSPERTLADWLASWEARGWRREYPWSPTVVVVNGREVARYALIRDVEG